VWVGDCLVYGVCLLLGVGLVLGGWRWRGCLSWERPPSGEHVVELSGDRRRHGC